MSDYTVYKYPLEAGDLRDQHGNMVVSVEMPKAHEILRADVQDGTICVWAGVRAGDEPVERRFIIVPTGSQYDQWGLAYVDTVFVGPLVFHIFRSTISF